MASLHLTPLLAVILTLGFHTSSYAQVRTVMAAKPQFNCLADHVKEGKELNQKRRPIYANWAGRVGLSRIDSLSVSTILIASELFSMSESREIDRKAREFQEKGIPIVCDDLAPIPDAGPEPICPKDRDLDCFLPIKGTETPDTQQPMIDIPDLVKIKPQAIWTAKLREAYQSDLIKTAGTSFPATLELARRILKEMNDHPRFLCIGRHLIESLIRIAALAPGYEALRIVKGMERSTLTISRRLIESHLTLLGTTGSAFGLDGLDTRAAVFQSYGIPLICNDVPPISDPGYPW